MNIYVYYLSIAVLDYEFLEKWLLFFPYMDLFLQSKA